jgi:uncharacterized Ntn-hydrolase superfamily protein
MTFSLIARCEKTNMFGTVISSSSISVASRCPWVRAGIGAAATQNVTDPSLGNLMLDYLEQGMSPLDAINKIKNEKTNIDYRQLLLIDNSGKTFFYSGNKILGTHGVAEGTNCIAAGNMLKSKDIPSAMVDSFKDNSNLFFPERLMLSLKAGLTAGGEEGSIHSAGIKVVDDTAWPLIDLRIDWSDNDPIEELYKLWKAYEPQMNDYKSRALDPTKAPSYGVPGDL